MIASPGLEVDILALTLGEKVQRMREKMGWTRKELAERAGLHPSHIGLIERGGRTEVRPETLEKLASALKVPLMYLMTDDPVEYLRARQASMPFEEYKRFIRMTSEDRLRYILDDLNEKWGSDTVEEIQQHPDFQLIANPPTPSVALPLEVSTGDGASQYINVIGYSDYERAIELARKYGVSGEELVDAIEFIYRLKSRPGFSGQASTKRPAQN